MVPPETLRTGERASSDDFRVAPILFRAAMRAANRAGDKDTTRRIVTGTNTVLEYGQFDGLDLDTARAVRGPIRSYLVAPCTYPRQQFRKGVTGELQRRNVNVLPKTLAGDLFWEKVGRFGSKAASEATYEVLQVDVGRVQDMTDDDAMREGVAHVQLPTRFPVHAHTPRGVFAWLWDQINGKGSWAANPWVWIYRYRVFPRNVEAMLADWEARP